MKYPKVLTSQRTIKSIISKWKEYGTSVKPPRQNSPPKLTGQSKRAIIREPTKRPMVKLEELEDTELRWTMSRALYGRVTKRKSLLEKKININVLFAICEVHNNHVE